MVFAEWWSLNEQGEFEGVISTLALANQLAAASKVLCSALGRLYDKENTREGQLTNAAEKADSFHVAMAEHPADRGESGSEAASPRSHRHIRFPG